MAVQTIGFRFVGIAPLLMHNGALANPLNPLVKEMKAITGLRKKTDEHHLELQRLEIVERLRQLEAFLCTGRKTKRECCNALGYAYERAFSRDLTDLETLGSGVVRVVDPGKKSQYYCPRAKAIFRHK